LPVTFYQSISQLPPFTDYSMARRTYRYFTEQPLYPFGYGLSYTSFRYDSIKVNPPEIDADGTVSASVNVTNTGKCTGDEVFELYLSRPDIDGAPLRALTGIQRVHLGAGDSKTVTFSLHNRDMSIVDRDGARRMMPGKVKVW